MMSAMKLQHEVSDAATPARVDAEHGVGVARLEGNR